MLPALSSSLSAWNGDGNAQLSGSVSAQVDSADRASGASAGNAGSMNRGVAQPAPSTAIAQIPNARRNSERESGLKSQTLKRWNGAVATGAYCGRTQ